MKKNFFILTGCSGGGKSTILKRLSEAGYQVVQEPGRYIVKQQLAVEGPFLPWNNPDGFLETALSHYMRDYTETEESMHPVFFDRGIPDAFQPDRKQPDHFLKAGRLFRYNPLVFMLPPWKEIYQNDKERQHSFEDALVEYNSLQKSYRILGYETCTVPRATPSERAAFIISRTDHPEAERT